MGTSTHYTLDYKKEITKPTVTIERKRKDSRMMTKKIKWKNEFT